MDKRKALFSGRTMVVVVVLAAVVLAAVGCWVAQQMYGLGITGMNNSNSWGLYIMAFMFLRRPVGWRSDCGKLGARVRHRVV